MEEGFSKNVKNVVFDIGQVLLKYDWRSYLTSLYKDEDLVETLGQAIFLSDDWEKGDEGVVTPEEWVELFVENAPEYEEEIRYVCKDLGGVVFPFSHTDGLIRYFKEKGCRLYYLSNYSEKLRTESKEDLKILEDFDGGIFSCDVKCIKPDEKIYKILLDQYNINPQETVFFDDRLENIEAANRLGIHGVVFTPQVAEQILDEGRKE